MAKYMKKPVVVEAFQTTVEMDIHTLEGTMHASAGDWIITGVNGEQYPCKPDIFEKTYSKVRDEVFSDEEVEYMKKFYFTFGEIEGCAHPNCVQPIVAPTDEMARKIMIENYGTKWCFQYTEDEWVKWVSERPSYLSEPELETLTYTDDNPYCLKD